MSAEECSERAGEQVYGREHGPDMDENMPSGGGAAEQPVRGREQISALNSGFGRIESTINYC